MAMKKSCNIDKLNLLYSQAVQVDEELFAEQRSNILLSAGDHYQRNKSRMWNRIRDSYQLSQEQKLRITKNHSHKIVRTLVNNIVSQAPGTIPVPNNPKELQDQKCAELNKSVWQYAKTNDKLNIEIQKWAKDYVEIGECAVKIYWDPSRGRFVGYEQEVDEFGQPVFDEMGQPMASEKAVFSGKLCLERVYAMNLLRAPEAKAMHESPYLIVRKMAYIEHLKQMVAGDEEKEKMIHTSTDETYFVFDQDKQSYNDSKNQTMLREHYYKPCEEYPNGYYYITVQGGILFEGELPFGVFPIFYQGWDEVSTTPRHRSVLKQTRPYQIEINRAGSKIAEHQVTLGDDKVILLNGSKYTSGPQVPGIRVGYVTGQAPTIIEGRTGNQFLPYVDSQISEMYAVANLAEDKEESAAANTDPWARLYSAIKDRRKFKMYTDKFESFLCEVTEGYLDLARHYFDDNMLIPMIGKSEMVNISEFKNMSPLCYQIKVEPMSDDIETMMGRQLSYTHLLQYVGGQLDKSDIGKIMKQMPFMNVEGAFDDFTLDYDVANALILALDRGQQPVLRKYDNMEYIGKRLSSRMQMTDFSSLNMQIQQNYEMIMQQIEQIGAARLEEMQRAQSGFIPSSGAMIKVDYYVPDPTNKTRSVRATLPAESIDWLIKKLADQGSAQGLLSQQNPAVQADMARMLLQNQAGSVQGGMPPAQTGGTLQ